MKRTLSVLLLLALLVLPMTGLADDIKFVITIGSADNNRTVSRVFDGAVNTVGDLKSYIYNLGGAWSTNAPLTDKLETHYSGTVEMHVSMSTSAYVVTPYGHTTVPFAEMDPDLGKPSYRRDDTTAKQSGNRSTYKNITGSTNYLYQVYANNRSIDFRVFANGSKTSFLEKFGANDSGKIRLTLTVRQDNAELKPVFTAEALTYLEGLNVAEVVISGPGGEQVYSMADLRAML